MCTFAKYCHTRNSRTFFLASTNKPIVQKTVFSNARILQTYNNILLGKKGGEDSLQSGDGSEASLFKQDYKEIL